MGRRWAHVGYPYVVHIRLRRLGLASSGINNVQFIVSHEAGAGKGRSSWNMGPSGVWSSQMHC